MIAIIPARLSSSNFPEKILEQVGGFTLIENVVSWVREVPTVSKTVVATENDELATRLEGRHLTVIRTSNIPRLGIERAAEAARQLEVREPVLYVSSDILIENPYQVGDAIVRSADEDPDWVFTLVQKRQGADELADRKRVKAAVAIGTHAKALYFSRAALASFPGEMFWEHLGVSWFEAGKLQELAALAPCDAERVENIEALRWLHHDQSIRVFPYSGRYWQIETEQDLERAGTEWPGPRSAFSDPLGSRS
jgi:3-deoxy-manno-octulosonate cytidylyltransferase (CMP-KDO synthetase)